MPTTKLAPLRPIRARIFVLAGTLALLLAAASITVLLLIAGDSTGDKAAARIDAIRTGLTVGAGTGGAAALALAARRQWLSERAQTHTESDAAERRVTEIFNKAVEQLGSEKAQVRLGGLYALERLGYAEAAQRQAIVNVLCGYLRMPYKPPYVPSPDDLFEVRPKSSRRTLRPGANGQSEESRRELEVRVTAQKILYGGLSKDDANGWRDPDGKPLAVTLRGATLVDFDLSGCRVLYGDFQQVKFVGTTHFEECIFDKQTHFDGAHFEGPCWISFGQFLDGAWFDGVVCDDFAWFDGATFRSHVRFPKSLFSGLVYFGNATLDGMAWFRDARFNGGVAFDNTTFISGDGALRTLDLTKAIVPGPKFVEGMPSGWRLVRRDKDFEFAKLPDGGS